MPLVHRPAGATAAQLPMPMQAQSSLPKVELMPLDATLPTKLAQAGSAESVLVPLVNQFGLMQQQMFDQFQQAIAMMVQMFGEMHRDQMKVIREELDRLHELTDELNALRHELANRSQDPSDVASSNDAMNTTEKNRPTVPESTMFTLPLTLGPPSPETRDRSIGVEPAAISQASMGPLPPTTPSAHRPAVKPDLSSAPPFLSNPLPAAPSSATTEASGELSQAARNGTIRPSASEGDTVLWLHQRIAALQNERTSRWQRILKLLPGVSS
jgi:hypothetical protein